MESEESTKRFSEKPRQKKLFSYYRRASHCSRLICKLTFHTTFWLALVLFIELCIYAEPTFCLFLEFFLLICIRLPTVPDHLPTWLEIKSLLKSTLPNSKSKVTQLCSNKNVSYIPPEKHCKNEDKINASLDNSIFLFNSLFGCA